MSIKFLPLYAMHRAAQTHAQRERQREQFLNKLAYALGTVLGLLGILGAIAWVVWAVWEWNR